MQASRSYTDTRLSRPPLTSLRRPLLYTSPARTQPINERRDTTTSSSAIADSPRRLLSYYISKAAYNTDTSSAAPTPQKDEHNMHTGSHRGDRSGITSQDNLHAADADSSTLAASFATNSLRPPPFSRDGYSNGLRSHSASVHVPQTPPLPQRRSLNADLRDSAHTEKASLASVAAPVSNAFNGSSPRPTVAAATSIPSQRGRDVEERPALEPSPHLPFSARPSEALSPAFVSNSATYSEEQQRQFESEVMSQVEALLQAQRSESYAELEAYRVTAEEAQATLRVVESALAEQLGCATAARFSPPPSSPSSLAPHVTVRLPSPPPDVERLALEMARAAAAATPSATRRLLDEIMSIQDGHDVPSILREVVRELYDELTRALVPPVMNFIQMQQQQQHSPQNHCCQSDGSSAQPALPQQDERLQRAQAEISALHEEVVALRRLLEGQSAYGCVLPSTTASADRGAADPHSGEAMPHALLDRLCTEFHAMLTRSRQECLKLRRDLEKERRQHFLTRIRLLKPAPLSLPVESITAASRAPIAATSQESISSPPVRSSTASQGRQATSAARSTEGGARGFSPLSSTPNGVDGEAAPHRWTPTPSPMGRVSGVGAGGSSPNGDGEVHDGFGLGDADAPLPSADAFSRIKRAPSALRRPVPASPALRSAVRVAEEVLRATGKSGEAGSAVEHPYHAYSGVHSRRSTACFDPAEARESASEGGAAQGRGPQHPQVAPSLSFVELAREDSRRGSIAVLRGQQNGAAARIAIPHRGGTAAAAAGARPNSEHEKRVWSKAVELLSRYAVE
ncbi:hypothetical protein ABL78_0755 [Leptomonas seymouri]|uniref:Uncharacterized protein n=1 Tax=Leptomonas seymouri TaxID=5684 RepID=A0A0N1I1L2_LEPSE|nr:hypothetical protein ABL78_0755 [Leptomonas seymouri]|eukprot:KPI90110.1 hypothetical protein ABL78_0755 [Leptomonas seymouri]